MPDSEAGTATDDTGTEATCSSDEFNWSDDEDAKSRRVAAEKKARCGRAVWLAFKKLTRKAPETFKTQLELFMAVSFWLKLVLDVSGISYTHQAIAGPSLTMPREPFSQPRSASWPKKSLSGSSLFVSPKITLADRLHENRITLKVLDKLSNAIPQFPIATKKKEKDRHSPGNSLEAGTMLGAGATFSAQASLFQFRSALPDLKFEGGADKKEYAVTKEESAEEARMERPRSRGRRASRCGRPRRPTRGFEGCHQPSRVEGLQVRQGRRNRSAYSARRLARQLFSTLSDVYSPRSHLIVGDFYPYFRVAADAKVAFAQFDKNNNGDISKNEMREAVQRISRERKALSASLKDMSSAVSKLDAVMIGVALIIILFVCLLIFNPGDNISSLIPLATIVLGFSFVFGNSAKTIFESDAAMGGSLIICTEAGHAYIYPPQIYSTYDCKGAQISAYTPSKRPHVPTVRRVVTVVTSPTRGFAVMT
ncbi:hypothetical protein FRC05_007957 [Tulasnella sp. 425]|nr:hypothetical protein FRC05_007957 [Tulasnella sp. 425]